MAVDPALIDAIRQEPAYLQVPLLTTALVESGGNTRAVGDGGHSGGAYQENDRGRGHGIPMPQRFDPRASTRRASREFQTFYARGARGASLAVRAQRPADGASYGRRYTQMVAEARRLLGSPATAAPGAALGQGAQAPASVPVVQQATALDSRAMQALADYMDRTQRQVLSGQQVEDPMALAPLLARRPAITPYQPQQPAPADPVATGAGGLVMPLSTKMPGASSYGVADGPEGVPTGKGGHIHGGMDWFAPGGAQVVAPVSGKVIEVKASRGNTGQVFGGVVKIQGADGRVFVFRHVDPRTRVGAAVRAGQPLASVTKWAGGSSHAHIEVWKSLAGGYNAGNLLDPATIFGR